MKRLLFALCALCLVEGAEATRLPDAINQSVYSSSEGFTLNPKDTSWIKATTPSDLSEKVEALFRTKKLSNNNRTLTVRVDGKTPHKTLKEYTGTWLKGFGQFGLDVIGHQYFRNKENVTGFVVDLSNTASKKKMRQAIFFKNSKAVILTCMDQAETFRESIKTCNELIQTFSWNEKVLAPAEKLTN